MSAKTSGSALKRVEATERKLLKSMQRDLLNMTNQQEVPWRLIGGVVVGILFIIFFFTSVGGKKTIQQQPLPWEVTVVIPTYEEAGNIPKLTQEIFESVREAGLTTELLIIDDNSQDGTTEVCEKLRSEGYNIRLVTRTSERGLSSAVLRGFREAAYDTLLVMDADRSHPPARIPDLVRPIVDGRAEFAVGSRYTEGGGVAKDWPLYRRIVSKGATLVAWPLAHSTDPMSGFFCTRKDQWRKARDLNPIGFKILLELMVKSGAEVIEDVPFVFQDRTVGESKLKAKVYVQYIRHLAQLYLYKYPLTVAFLFVLGIAILYATYKRWRQVKRYTYSLLPN
eukprot:Clim_evm7s28 gene=Clim_evmTU7s28